MVKKKKNIIVRFFGAIWRGIRSIRLHTWVLLIFMAGAVGVGYWAYLDIQAMPSFGEYFKKIGITVLKVLAVPLLLWLGLKLSRHFVETWKAKSHERQAVASENLHRTIEGYMGPKGKA